MRSQKIVYCYLYANVCDFVCVSVYVRPCVSIQLFLVVVSNVFGQSLCTLDGWTSLVKAVVVGYPQRAVHI